MIKNECPYFGEAVEGALCEASLTGMRPNSLEVESFCAGEEHYRCPILLASILRGGFRVSAN